MVSMKDISLKCNVSIATVSKALNDHSDISEQTKEYIRETARNMGYFPNASAKQLKTHRSHNLGILFIDEAGSGLTHDFYANILDSFKVTAENAGYDLTFINCNRASLNMSFLEHSRYRGVDGVVIACVKFDEPEVYELAQSDIPVVTIDHVFDQKTAVISDNIQGMKDLVTYIHKECHHERIAFIHGADSAVTRNRLTSFYRTMENLGLTVPDEYILEADYRDTDGAYSQTLALLDLPKPPTCILYPDDFSSIGGINAIKSRGFSIPDDISIAGYDGINLAKVLEPKLTTIEQDTKEIGRKAALQLIDLIEKPKTTLIERIIVSGRLLRGDSVKVL
ncbi:MAG: LacI family transcriptional regulator [Lachnospiraceae bacterium]|nr:LacI family transcriptional regulator [Lachnospiraceae bacterium]